MSGGPRVREIPVRLAIVLKAVRSFEDTDVPEALVRDRGVHPGEGKDFEDWENAGVDSVANVGHSHAFRFSFV